MTDTNSYLCAYTLPSTCGCSQTNYEIWRDTEAEARMVAVKAIVDGAVTLSISRGVKPEHVYEARARVGNKEVYAYKGEK